MTFYFSISQEAYEYWRDIAFNHPKRPERGKRMLPWDGTGSFQSTDYLTDKEYERLNPTTTKGLYTFITNFLANPTPHISSIYYSSDPPYRIKPEYFVDLRRQDLKTRDYEECGYPGFPSKPESKQGVYWKEFNITTYENYTTWTSQNGSPKQKGMKELHPDFLKTAHQIVDYWHISLNRPPRSSKEAFSALLNAIGLGYLWHPKLRANPTPHFPNVDYSQLDIIKADILIRDQEFNDKHGVVIDEAKPKNPAPKIKSTKLKLPTTKFNLGQYTKEPNYHPPKPSKDR